MKCLLLSECRSGMVLAKDIYNKYGTLIASKETNISNLMMDTFANNQVDLIFVYDDNDTTNSPKVQEPVVTAESQKREQFHKKYEENTSHLKEVMKDIGNGKNVNLNNLKDINNTVSELTAGFSTSNVLNYLKQVRGTDDYTYNHCINVSILCLTLGKWLGLDEETLNNLQYAGMLHDIGKAYIHPDILNKPGKLTPHEFDVIKKHTTYGYKLAKTIPGIDAAVLDGILMHHEREDGSGYPGNLISDNISLFGKIVAIADIYDAMTSNRSYHNAESPFRVLEMFQNSSFGKLDPRILMTFFKNISSYYVGDEVVLNTGEIGKIVYINPSSISRPILEIDASIVDLSKEEDLCISSLYRISS